MVLADAVERPSERDNTRIADAGSSAERDVYAGL
jgi:hypothetical protein